MFLVCGGIFTETTGELLSPYYPNAYPADRTCVYIIKQPVGTTITLTFLDFDVESTSGCFFDYVQVTVFYLK